MADNLNISTADGQVAVATDWIENVHYQRFKLVQGADGSADADCGKYSGAGGTNALPVTNYPASDFMSVGAIAVAPQFVSIAISSATNTVLATPASGKRIRVVSMFLTMEIEAGDETVALDSGAGGTPITGNMAKTATADATRSALVIVLPYNPMGWFQTVTDAVLSMRTVGSTTQVHGALTWIDV